MFNPAILKKKKSALADMEDSKPMMVGKKAMNHAMDSMAPEMEDEDEDEEEEKPKKMKMGPEASIEIELMLSGAKKKKK
jgi:hypothetical protein